MVQLEGLAFLLAGLGTVLVLAAIASLVLLRRRSPVVVASGPSYAMLQALGGSVWVMSTIIFNGHFSAYNPREVSLPTCFFWRCKGRSGTPQCSAPSPTSPAAALRQTG